jgi:hypothetical protein
MPTGRCAGGLVWNACNPKFGPKLPSSNSEDKAVSVPVAKVQRSRCASWSSYYAPRRQLVRV